jgi:glycine/D-amino acid oxidase-like deaminating enzyme
LRLLDPRRSVVLFERGSIGAGASGRTGGMVLAETAGGDLPELGDVLGGFQAILRELDVTCDLRLPGTWEIGRKGSLIDSLIAWKDSGELRAIREVPGGTIDPGRMAAGLASAAHGRGAWIIEGEEVEHMEFGDPIRIEFGGKRIAAKKVLLATNAMSLELAGLMDYGQPKFTMAVATEPLTDGQLREIGLASGRPFYTIDFPYLWGRLLPGNGAVFGAGLVHAESWREFEGLDVELGEAAELIARLENRVRRLHSALQDVKFTHRWGGPILVTNNWEPIFEAHAANPNVIVLGGYCGHGVAQSVYLGRWAAEAMLGLRSLPQWGKSDARPDWR